ncbi:MAG: LacI family DNA-binding transcriptional regulator [Anaerolineaceae bacterium]|nr:LacI family DNA-binding transcriptional regulator [Anaerolineaceae bacterium]
MSNNRLTRNNPPTIADVARRAGCSISTVSRVFNGSAPVTDDKAIKVRLAITQLGYSPQTAARNLASQRTNTLGLMLPGIGGDFLSLLLSGVEQAANEAGYDLLISTPRRSRSELQHQSALGRHNTDGMLVLGEHDTAELTRLCASGFPLVLLYRSAPNTLRIPSVTIENKSGACQAVDHLIEVHGLTQIGFLRGPQGSEDSHWRARGYRESLESHGLSYDPDLVANCEFTEIAAMNAVDRWIQQGRLPQAIFAGSDEAARGAYTALNQAGIRIPQQVALVGFDDVPMARFLNPPLTTVRTPADQVGRIAVQQLVRLIQTGEAELQTQLPTELVVRASCGCHFS